MRQYTVIYESGKCNWSAYVPDLPGCIATAKTREQVEKLVREAIEFHIEGLEGSWRESSSSDNRGGNRERFD